MNTTTQDRPLPKSYMPEEDKIGMSQNAIYACEAADAKAAGDEEASWAWLALAELPSSAKYILKEVCGDEFLKARGFNI
ncbi:hypothetical protein AGMMS49960_05270 [Betaproteobacteria bacterium]|nr:hypothetical protein AGMMS49543_05180 [Betaproteobacteria bacterium]GHT99595.1 hypothetical protein AGMMS49960_05270 [Betaproteobacteria bacterium]GHU06512.1 hypothetical protein AGMMS50225_01620 [Betaproteobacteria bacterium]GHU20963.1 hypothetical protein AGMMS50243_17460 [Betaproteobacteria bacterium]